MLVNFSVLENICIRSGTYSVWYCNVKACTILREALILSNFLSLFFQFCRLSLITSRQYGFSYESCIYIVFECLLGPFISYLLFITFHLQQHRDVKNIYRKFIRTCPISILRFKSNKLPALSYFTPHPTFPAFKIFNSCSSVKRILYFITLAASGLIFHCVG